MTATYLTDAERASLALREYHASLPADDLELVTLEFRHPALTEPARVVNDRASHDLVLEATAPVNAGETVTYNRSAFLITWPGTSKDDPPEMNLEVMNANGLLEEILDQTLESQEPVAVTVRSWLLSDPSGPAAVLEGLEIRESVAADRAVSATAGTYVWDRIAGEIYTRETHPLIGG